MRRTGTQWRLEFQETVETEECTRTVTEPDDRLQLRYVVFVCFPHLRYMHVLYVYFSVLSVIYLLV